MKTKNFIPLLMAGILCLTSCNQIYSDTTNDSSTESTILPVQTTETTRDPNATTYPPATIPPIETEETETYVDTFESFMEFPSGRGYFFGKVTLYPEQSFDSIIPFVLFRVLDIKDDNQGVFMNYYVQIVEIYGLENYNTDKVYRMAWRGHLDEQLYGRPPLEIGKVYGRFLGVTEEMLEGLNLWQAALIFGVEEQNGKRYIYGYGTDLSDINCKIEITDDEENSIYKVGKHDKAIAYLNTIGQELPTFDYKCDLDEFYAELQKRCS